MYAAIADVLGEDVASGRLKAGARLPTHRDLAEHLGVTVGTVTRAYAEAARRGLVSGEVGRGTFVRARAAAAMPAPPPDGTIDLSTNVPAPAGDRPERALGAALTELARGGALRSVLGYAPEGGALRHREAGAAWIGRSRLQAGAADVVVCSGSQHALTALLATLVRPGDLVLCESLTYAGFKAVASLLHLRVHGLAMDGQGLRPDALEAACRTAAPRALYCVPSIQNPTASVMPAARREQVVEIARRHGLTIIEDDVHGLLATDAPPPLAALAPERTHYVLSTSKTLAPGLRTAYVRAVDGTAPRLAAAARATTWGAAPLLAEVAASWIFGGAADEILAARRAEAAVRQGLARAVFGDALRAHPAGYHGWLTLPPPWRTATFVEKARARGVLVTPAEAFAVGRDELPHGVRLSLGGPASRGELERALAALAAVLQDPSEAALAIV